MSFLFPLSCVQARVPIDRIKLNPKRAMSMQKHLEACCVEDQEFKYVSSCGEREMNPPCIGHVCSLC